jgi:hypothetical protein
VEDRVGHLYHYGSINFFIQPGHAGVLLGVFYLGLEGYFPDNYYLNMAIWCFSRISL